MDTRLFEAFSGKYDNCLLPFLWMHSGNRARLPELVREVRDSGARALCVESRPHDHFCEDEWWEDMDILLAECAKRDMRVWILDDKHFPTGYANGLIPKKYPERRKWQLREDHIDLIGPMKDAALPVAPPEEKYEETLLRAAAVQRTDEGEQTRGEAVELTGNVQDGYLFWDVPEGVWRVFFYYKTRAGAPQTDYIHPIDPASTDVLLEAVYEPHYAHYARYFGNTIAGFFSDEPSLGNDKTRWSGRRECMYDNTVGQPGLALPWTDDVPLLMQAELAYDPVPHLGSLWYDSDRSAEMRVAYMNAVTRLWRDAFSKRIGDWCRARGVSYIGHIIEDMNAHARLMCSAGHYFRSLEGQDMSGIDVVLHQILPGFAHHIHTASCAGGRVDPTFFDYVLGKLAASAAHLETGKNGLAMCEVFGAYGWAEGTPCMKWLMDHLLVRGVNRFVPHAFSPKYPDPDCPPHFYAGGDNPQFPGYARLMDYTQRVAHILAGARHVAGAAILYHAEAEWSGKPYTLTEKPAKALYDRQIDYDIVPFDYLETARAADGKLRIADERFDCLVVPGCAYLPPRALKIVNALADAGVPVLYTDFAPEGAQGEIVPLARLADRLDTLRTVRLSPEFPLLRVYRARRDGRDVFMLVNESVRETFEGEILFPVSGEAALYQPQFDALERADARDGKLRLTLAPYESLLVAFGENAAELPARPIAGEAVEPNLVWTIARAPHGDMTRFERVEGGALVNMTGPKGDPGFSGVFRYETTFDAPADCLYLDLGAVGQTARVTLNGSDLGIRMCPPYRYDVRGIVRATGNRLVVYAANTLAHEHPDPFSRYMQIPPSGLQGPVRLIREAKA